MSFFYSIGSDYLALEDGFEYKVTLRPSTEEDELIDESVTEENATESTNEDLESGIDTNNGVDEVSSIKTDEWMMEDENTHEGVLKRITPNKRTFRGKTKFKVSLF